MLVWARNETIYLRIYYCQRFLISLDIFNKLNLLIQFV